MSAAEVVSQAMALSSRPAAIDVPLMWDGTRRAVGSRGEQRNTYAGDDDDDGGGMAG